MTNEILKYDEDFTEATFITKADHIYMMILNAIIDKDLNEVKHYLSENVYNYVKSNSGNMGIASIIEENTFATQLIDENASGGNP